MPRCNADRKTSALCGLTLLLAGAAAVGASEWPAWRGVDQVGSSPETGLISSWSRESGENLIWRADFVGRSTPVVMNGRVYVIGRGGEGKLRRELVAAYDAGDGRRLWQRDVPVHLTTVPFNRAGWASLTGDPETGYVYAQGIAGPFICYDEDGEVVWQYDLAEELGRFSGYGGRTQTPVIDEDRVIVSVINSSWGPLGAPRHRYYAFDKRSGAVLSISTPGGNPYDLNTQSNGVVAVIGGRRLFISGNADGHVYALEARTGEKVWSFELSKRGINSTPLVAGSTVFVGHSEENIDVGTLGRTVAIDATGQGDVTATHERWRRDVSMGFPSPAYADGRLYVVDNSANLSALDPDTGATLWQYKLGTVGKGSPVLADGKLFVTETNGHFHILATGEVASRGLDEEYLTMPDGRYAEIYGSPAIAYRRIYFTTEEGLYCLGNREAPFEVAPIPPPALAEEERGSETPALVQVVPAEVTVRLGDTVPFELRAFNANGRYLRPVDGEWSLESLRGQIDGAGQLALDADAPNQAGFVKARSGELEAVARVRVFGPLPYREDFESVEGRGRPYWIGAGRYQVIEQDGNKLLEKPVAPQGLLRSNLFLGGTGLGNYTVTAEVMGNQQGRRRTDVGLINGGYFLDLQGNSQKLEIRTWSAVLRMAETMPFTWEMGKWYVMKLRVERSDERALVQGKVWPRGEQEPDSWTLEAEDPLPAPAGTPSGAPGVQGYSPAPIYFDNIEITVN